MRSFCFEAFLNVIFKRLDINNLDEKYAFEKLGTYFIFGFLLINQEQGQGGHQKDMFSFTFDIVNF